MHTNRQEQEFDRHAIQVVASNLGVRQALKEACQWAKNVGAAAPDIANLELILGEVLNNIVEHAVPDRLDTCFDLDISMQADGLHFQTKDDGHAMPDHKIPSSELPSTDVPLQDMPEGGFGWPLFLMLAQEVTYTRHNETNLLQFRLPFSE